MPKINAAGLAIIEKCEGCVLTAYADPVGIPTICYGHTGEVNGQPLVVGQTTLTQDQCTALLEDDLEIYEDGVNNLCAINLTPNQFSALVSFAYNVGLGALGDSTLMRLVNAGNFSEAAQQFGLWVYAGGQVLPGLVTRRAAEKALFLEK
jgi:GH24 family phage-related lysozyme (muramidase)